MFQSIEIQDYHLNRDYNFNLYWHILKPDILRS